MLLASNNETQGLYENKSIDNNSKIENEKKKIDIVYGKKSNERRKETHKRGRKGLKKRGD